MKNISDDLDWFVYHSRNNQREILWNHVRFSARDKLSNTSNSICRELQDNVKNRISINFKNGKY